MGETAATVGGDSLPRRIIERRIHEDVGNRLRSQSGSREGPRRCCDVEDRRPHPRIQSVELRVLRCKPRQLRIDLDQHDLGAFDAKGQRQPCRADAGPEVDRAFAHAHRTCRREQNCVMAHSVAPFRLLEPQPAAERGILGHLNGHGDEARVRARHPRAIRAHHRHSIR
jgi:hypothetical protein